MHILRQLVAGLRVEPPKVVIILVIIGRIAHREQRVTGIVIGDRGFDPPLLVEKLAAVEKFGLVRKGRFPSIGQVQARVGQSAGDLNPEARQQARQERELVLILGLDPGDLAIVGILGLRELERRIGDPIEGDVGQNGRCP